MVSGDLLGLLHGCCTNSRQVSEAAAQDMSAELQQFEQVCFDEAGEWLATDGCIKSAESLGIELENINESMDAGCVLSDLYEDYSCKGPSAPSSSSEATLSEQEEGGKG